MSELRRRYARLIGWTALFTVAASSWLWIDEQLGGRGVGRYFGIGAWLSLVALFATYAYVAIGLAGLASMH